MMKAFVLKVFLLFMGVGLTGNIFGQGNLNWTMLADVTYSTKFDEQTQSVIMVPEYGTPLVSLNEKEVEIKGYIIPLDTEGKQYILSAFPFSACFFCGNAGKESVMELMLAEEGQTFKTDQIASFKGILKLNYGDFGLNYTLENAEVVELE